MSVVSPHEIMLYGTRFPINGGVRHTMITPFPPKITFGDYTRDDQTILSTWLLTRFSGGLGIEFGEMPRHQDRFRFGDLESRYRYTTLGPRVVFADANGADALLITDYAGSVYVITETTLYRWSTSSLTSIDTFDSGVGKPNSVCQFNGDLYIQCKDGIAVYDGSTLTQYHDDVDDEASVDLPGVASVVWDDKLFRITADGEFFYYVVPSDPDAAPSSDFYTAWESCGRLHLPTGYCGQLVLYFDLTGEIVIHAITKVGVFSYDFGARKFYPTALSFPYTKDAGSGAIMWRGELYVPAAASIYKYNGSVIQNVGPSKDDGLPPELHGDVVSLVEGHGFFFAVVQALQAQTDYVLAAEDNVRSASAVDRDVMAEQAATQGAVLCSPGSAWHTLFYEQAGARMGAAAAIATSQGYRLWFSTSNGLYYTDLSTELHNPLQSPTAEFKQEGFLETVWYDSGWSEIDKVAFFLDLETAGCSVNNTITVSAAYDDSNNYQELGTVTSNGRTLFRIGGEEGKIFRSIRFKIVMTRGADLKQTPIMKSAALAYLRCPEPAWGFEVDLQLTQSHNGKTAKELINDLVDRIAKAKVAGRFVYHDEGVGENFEGRVKLTKIAGATPPGSKRRGRYTVALLEITEPE